MCLLNLNIAVLSTVFHLFILNKTDCCALFQGGEADISSPVLHPSSTPWAPVMVPGSAV